MNEQWKINGTYFEGCNCDTLCPCFFGGKQTEEDCSGLVAWHIDKGNYGQLDLEGLNIVLAFYCPGIMRDGIPWKVALYLDKRASEKQYQALKQIFTGQAGGAFAALIEGAVGEVLGVKRSPITYKAEGRKRSLRINGIAEATVEAMKGPDEEDIRIDHLGYIAASPDYQAVVGSSEMLSYHDHGFEWEFSGKNGLLSPFAYQGP